MLSLVMYARPRRLVHRQCVGEKLLPKRGIGAGSAFATYELLAVLARAIERMRAQDLSIFWTVHVDDISASAYAFDALRLISKIKFYRL